MFLTEIKRKKITRSRNIGWISSLHDILSICVQRLLVLWSVCNPHIILYTHTSEITLPSLIICRKISYVHCAHYIYCVQCIRIVSCLLKIVYCISIALEKYIEKEVQTVSDSILCFMYELLLYKVYVTCTENVLLLLIHCS